MAGFTLATGFAASLTMSPKIYRNYISIPRRNVCPTNTSRAARLPLTGLTMEEKKGALQSGLVEIAHRGLTLSSRIHDSTHDLPNKGAREKHSAYVRATPYALANHASR